ncbi:uncharacterized protein LOC128557024 isoform X2 [Mercenaria mercenaria]|uniref:uncharacterized protein LOC128557024 isoform X2 n=1 Tax=Mercenaria mercenaria TaxID=6596 RepID=UPI00234EE309|nr:uncharacterized protein LOC128557024 isoform X2 [Mercenaria mercenaria]
MLDKSTGSVNVEAFKSPLTTYVLRLGPGAEIVSSLQKLVKENQLEAAFVITCVGSVTKAKLRMADSVTINTYENGHYEIVSLVGTLSAGGHLHGSFSDKDGNVIGGHVIGDLFVFTTAEMVIGDCALLRFNREHDERSGYKELELEYGPGKHTSLCYALEYFLENVYSSSSLSFVKEVLNFGGRFCKGALDYVSFQQKGICCHLRALEEKIILYQSADKEMELTVNSRFFHDDMLWIIKYTEEPSSLQHISRVAIRRCLYKPINRSQCEKLSLPTKLLKYIMLDD